MPTKTDRPSANQPLGRITTLESLREHLQWAIELEHFTIPPYLCALYSLDSGRNIVRPLTSRGLFDNHGNEH